MSYRSAYNAVEMEDGVNKPIFIVGSPRSGTSILSLCLGQHPNIIALEESGWMGDLAINLAVYYQTGTPRGDYSLLSSMDVEKGEFFSLQPLAQRVNSSNVPADFEIDHHGTDLSLVEQAMRLSQHLDQSLQPMESCPAAIKEIEAGFDERAQFVTMLAQPNTVEHNK